MAERIKHSKFKKKVREFSKMHFGEANPALKVLGVMVEKVEDQSRVVLMTGQDADLDLLNQAAREHFGDLPFRIMEMEEPPKGTIGAANSGIGVMRQGANEFGTVGGWFKMETDRNGNPMDQNLFFGLSNNHVIGNCGNGAPGDVLTDVNGVPIGSLFDVSHLDPNAMNEVDMAVFQVQPGLELNWNPAPPQGWTGVQAGYGVYKQGARTGYTEGTIVGTGDVLANLCGVNYHFTDVLIIKGTNGEFSAEGDSGSIVMTMNHLMAGLLFAKSGEFAYACRIKHLGKMNLLF